jgi:TfoX/Sxy family transcriptional regulator of competence genes
MEMEKPSDRMVELFQSVAPGGPEAVERKMFGQPAATVHGHMFMGLFGDLFQVRLSDADGTAALAAGATPFAPMGRTMAGYYGLPDSILADGEQLTGWIDRAYANAAAFPPKEAKPRKAPPRK